MALLLITHLMERPIAWAGQQAGGAINNIVPAAGHEAEQTGASNSVLLSLPNSTSTDTARP